MKAPACGPFVARSEIDKVLAGKPTRHALVCRANAVERLAEDCARFFPWPALHDSLMADVKRLREAAVAEARAVPDGRNVCKVDPGFRWDGDAQQHVPQVLVEFAPVPANAPNDSPGWLARDAFVAALAATPSPAEQPKPALPEPDGYFYEVDGYFGIHRQFDTAPYNGMRPHRTVGYFTADTTRAAIDAALQRRGLCRRENTK